MSRRTIVTILGVLAIVIVAAGTSAYFVWRLAKRTFVSNVEAVLKPKEQTLDLATVVTQVRELNRLETAAMKVTHIGRVSQSFQMVPNALAGDEITFLATGDVIAGVDLARLQPGDVWREPDGTIVMRLPPPQMLVSRVDNQASRVIQRKTGVLRRADVDLETRARQHAEENIRQEALRRGILQLAGDNAEKKLAELMRTFGAQKVRFVREVVPAER
ncbi:MAG TPA: DUF4230 domain-containing protein [Thermoanaerobaculia bacterium]|jgi:hypothetical protein